MKSRVHLVATAVGAFALATTAGNVSEAQAPSLPERPKQLPQYSAALQQLRVNGAPTGTAFSVRGEQVDVPLTVLGGTPPYTFTLDTRTSRNPPYSGEVQLVAHMQMAGGVKSASPSARTVRLIRVNMPAPLERFARRNVDLRVLVRDAAGTVIEVPFSFQRTYSSGVAVIQSAELQTSGNAEPVGDAAFFFFRLTLSNYDTRELPRIECSYGGLALDCDPQFEGSGFDMAGQPMVNRAMPQITVLVPRVDRGLAERRNPAGKDNGVTLRVRNPWGLGPNFVIGWPKLQTDRPPDIRATHSFTVANGQTMEIPFQPEGLPSDFGCNNVIRPDGYGLRSFWSRVQLGTTSDEFTLLAPEPHSALSTSNLPRLSAVSPGQHSATVDYYYYRRALVCQRRVVCPENPNADASRTCPIPPSFL
jgi:hypothetical protein